MATYQTYLSFFIVIVLAIGFIFSIIYHKKRLKHILDIETVQELKQSKYIMNTYLASANSFLFMFLAVVLILIIELFSYNYLFHTNLIFDVFLIAIIGALIGSIYPLMRLHSAVSNWLEFWAGFMSGCVFSTLFFPSEYFSESIAKPLSHIVMILSLSSINQQIIGSALFGLAPFFMLAFLLILISIGLFLSQRIFVMGVAFGYLVFLVFLHLLQNLVRIFFWPFFVFVIGVLFGVCYINKPDFHLWAFLLFFAALKFFVNIVMILVYVLGFVLFLLFVLEPNMRIKFISIVCLLASLVFVVVFTETFMGVTFISIMALSEFFIATLYKDSIRTIFKRWLLLAIKSKNNKIDLSSHESIPDFKKLQVKKNSFFFVYLKYLLLRYLEHEGFHVDIIEEENKQGTFIRSIFVNLK